MKLKPFLIWMDLDYSQKVPVIPPISSNTEEREREAESVNFMGNEKRATEEASSLLEVQLLGVFSHL